MINRSAKLIGYIGFGFMGIMFLFFLSCDGSGSSNDQLPSSDNDHFSVQALLGPIVGATVDVYSTTNLSNGALCQVTTLDDPDIDLAGVMNIPSDCVEDDGFYLLVARGGEDIDPDDDGVRNSVPSKVNGKLHALFTRDQIQAGQVKITAVTELAYQYTSYLLSAGYSEMEIEEALSQVAQVILTQDISGDGGIDYLDLAAWHPRLHSRLFRPGSKRLNLIAGLILDGVDPHTESIETILNITLGVKDDFPEFSQSSWIRTESDLVIIDGSAYHFQEDQAGNLSYEVDFGSYNIYAFGDYQPTTLIHNNLRIEAHQIDIETIGPGEWEIKSPPFIEITNVYTGAIVSTMELTSEAVGIKVIDNQLYLLRWEGIYSEPGGLDVIDISDPANPVLRASAVLPEGGVRWVFHDSEVTVVEPGHGLGDIIHVFDVSSTGMLSETYSYRTNGQMYAWSMRASKNAVLIWDQSHPKSLILIDKTINEQKKIDFESEIIDFDLKDTNIYALTEDFGLRIIELGLAQSLSNHPAVRWALPAGGLTIGLLEDELWVLKGHLGSSVVSLTDPESPEIVSEVLGGLDPIVLDDNHVLGCDLGGMKLYERTLTGWKWENVNDSTPWCLERNNEYVFVASSEMVSVENGFNARLDILYPDVDKLDVPYHQLIFDHDAQFDDMAIGPDHLFLVDSATDIFQIVDISNPAQAFSQSIIKAGGRKIALFGQHAYVASGQNGIRLINISDPTSPVFNSSIPSSDALYLTISNGRLYLADGSGGLKVFDIMNDGSLSYISTVFLSEQANAVETDGNWVWVATDSELYGLNTIIQDIP